jgi:hypothetical protein
MFGGWFAIIGVTYLVYRCAKANGRRWLLWVLLCWVLIFGTALVAAMLAAAIATFRAGNFPPEWQRKEIMMAPIGIGMLLGAIASVVLANRPTRSRT